MRRRSCSTVLRNDNWCSVIVSDEMMTPPARHLIVRPSIEIEQQAIHEPIPWCIGQRSRNQPPGDGSLLGVYRVDRGSEPIAGPDDQPGRFRRHKAAMQCHRIDQPHGACGSGGVKDRIAEKPLAIQREFLTGGGDETLRWIEVANLPPCCFGL